jgi:hypothetical protein
VGFRTFTKGTDQANSGDPDFSFFDTHNVTRQNVG